MNIDTKTLENIGLSKGEVTVFLALLKLGSSTAGPVIKESGLQSSAVYHCLERMISKGLVSYLVKSNKKYFEVSDPSKLLDFLENRKRDLNNQEKKIKKMMPQLLQIREPLKEKNIVSVYEGIEGLRYILYKLLDDLKPGDERVVFGARSGYPEKNKSMASFFRGFHKRRIRKKIGLRIIFNEDLKEIEGKYYEKMSFTKVRYMQKGLITPSGVNIDKNSVLIIIYDKNPTTIAIFSKKVADSYRKYFEIMWKVSRK